MSGQLPVAGRRAFLTGLSVLGTASLLHSHPRNAAPSDRAEQAFAIRLQAARDELAAPEVVQTDNGDEALYPSFIGSYSKGLPHDESGQVDRTAYRFYLAGLRSQDLAILENLRLGGNQPLINPVAGIAFDLEGRDIQKLAAPPAPALASRERAREAIELYWMALVRDIGFGDYAENTVALGASVELGIPPNLLFRGFTAGDQIGPYVSQLFLTPFAYGQYRLDGRLTVFRSGLDYLTDPNAWLACRNGQGPFGTPVFDSEPRYFRCGRDLASYVHSDQACEAFYNAGLRLYALNAPLNPGNPYLGLKAQAPFATFGPPHFLTLQAEAALRAVKAVFYQKWFVHRALRPEAFGGLVQAMHTGRAEYPLDPAVLGSHAVAAVHERFGSRLLPQAFPEGCPQHPSYTQAHGGVAGACATILKAAFDGATPWLALAPSLKQASPDGLSLENYTAGDAAAITVNGEINKLCGNIALARNFAGVHWRSDYEAGLRLGEEMALTVLSDQRRIYGEAFTGFRIQLFNGREIVI